MRALVESRWVQSVWRDSKRWRSIPLGPLKFTFKFARRYRSSYRQWLIARRLLGTEQIRGQSHAIDQSDVNAFRAGHVAQDHSNRGSAVVIGVGPGLGEALAALLARKGLPLALVSRCAPMLEDLTRRLQAINPKTVAYPCDATDERSVIKLMREIEGNLGVPEIVIYAVQEFSPGSLLTTEVAAFEECWRANCLGAFIVSREAARRMQPLRRGTILFAGATSATIGRCGYVNLAIGKFGLRALAQVIARELSPLGIHVAHVLIDGEIAENLQATEEPQIQPDQLAEVFWGLHMQPPSCWTSELDVRPATERFWEHC